MRKSSMLSLGITAALGVALAPAPMLADAGTTVELLPLRADTTVTVALEPVAESATTGAAIIQSTAEGQTAVDLEVQNVALEGESLVAVLVLGTCEEPGELRAALGALQEDAEGAARGAFLIEGAVEEVFDVPTAVQVQSQGAEGAAVACGQVAALTDDQPSTLPAATDIPEPLPTGDEPEAEEEAVDETHDHDAAEAADPAEAEAAGAAADEA